MASTRTVVGAGGPRPISEEGWESFSGGMLNRKSSDRHAMFTRSCFVRSPDVPADCTGEKCARIVEIGANTWVELSRVEAADCIPAGGRCDPAKVRGGQLAVVVTRKCHEMVFEGRVFMLRGPQQEEAVMHATSDGRPTADVSLPEGWRISEEPLTQPLVLRPFGGGDACYYNILHDARAQSYHQIRYARGEYP